MGSEMKMQFEKALNSLGYSLMTEEDAYMLAAWLHHYGNHEAAVLNANLVSDILIAQNKLKIFGGERIEPTTLIKLQSYLRQGKDAHFMKQIFKKYNIKYEKSK